MKGGFYGVRSIQTSIILVALVCATMLIWPMQLPYPDVAVPGGQTFISAAAANQAAAYGSSNAEAEHKALGVSSTSGKANEDQKISLDEHSDSAAIDGGGKQSKESSNVVTSKITINTSENEACNLAKGKWVFDNSRPLYSGFGCKRWLSKTRACRQTQRTNFDYEAVRWLPRECHATEEFTGYRFLQRMRNKTLAFIGDSLGGQQFESLMCMVTGGDEIPEVVDVGEEYGLVNVNEAGRPDGQAYRFVATNTTILHYWSATLCDLEPLEDDNTRNFSAADIAMHLDRPPAFLQRYIHSLDVLVLSTWNHWNPRKFKENRWIMHVGDVPYTANRNNNIVDIGGARNFTIHGIVHWVDFQIRKHPGLEAFYRSLSPRHFSKGGWNTGGSCHSSVPLAHGNEVLKDESSDSVGSKAVEGTKVKLLDITALSQLRNEAHIGRKGGRSGSGLQQDCLHWCLPGVPDTWNEILFAQI